MSEYMNVQDLQTTINPDVHIVQKVKFDPIKNMLGSIVDASAYRKGDVYIYDLTAFEELFKNTTSATYSENLSALDTASGFETSVSKYRRLWESIPTIEDYFELDAITDADETESAFYKASEKYGW